MAVIYVYWAPTRTHPDSNKQFAVWRKGGIIGIYDDAECPEPPAAEQKGIFVRIPGLSKAELMQYVGDTVDGNKRILQRNKYLLDSAELPSLLLQEIATNREITINFKSEVLRWLRNTETGQLVG